MVTQAARKHTHKKKAGQRPASSPTPARPWREERAQAGYSKNTAGLVRTATTATTATGANRQLQLTKQLLAQLGMLGYFISTGCSALDLCIQSCITLGALGKSAVCHGTSQQLVSQFGVFT